MNSQCRRVVAHPRVLEWYGQKTTPSTSHDNYDDFKFDEMDEMDEAKKEGLLQGI